MPTSIVIDDDVSTCEILQTCLEQVGYSVVAVINGQEALNTLQQQTFDLITLDLAMPKINGAAIFDAIRADAQHNNAVVVVITGTPHMIGAEMLEQADYVMNKPFDVREFAQFAERVSSTRG